MTMVARVVLDKFFLTHRCVKHDMTLHSIELFQKIANEIIEKTRNENVDINQKIQKKSNAFKMHNKCLFN